MTRPVKSVESGHISCKVCMKEVPKSAATSAESTDYVLHFCGLGCYDQWTRASDAGAGKDAGTANPAAAEETKIGSSKIGS
ncbi:MAG: DUF3330 domain-containing protein [Burkholderiaceae bacterium]|nr:DUF3330 domain-containing protein [Burkholderiaceae bacterium]